MRSDTRELFRHVSAEKADLYRAIMDVFAAAKRQFRLHLRPDEVLAEASWPGVPPIIEQVQQALSQLTEWGNLESQPDTARVASISDFYRARYIYRLSQGGEAVETALAAFALAIARRAELQAVALEDIASRLNALSVLAETPERDAAKVHEILRDLVRVFDGLAENAQAFMASIGRSIELQRGDAAAVVAYKKRLIDYLSRFIGDLVSRSGSIAAMISGLDSAIEPLLWRAAERESRDAAPGEDGDRNDALAGALASWRERWQGLRRWFLSSSHEPSQAELLRSKARSAIPQLLAAVAALNERRAGRSDRSADFRALALWFADCRDDADAHRLARAAFAINPARHFLLDGSHDELPANTSWAEAPAIRIHPRLRQYGEATPRGPLPSVRDRSRERMLLARQAAEEHEQMEAARARLATGNVMRLSEIGRLERHEFRLFLALLAEALSAQRKPDEPVERQSADGLLRVRLEPLGAGTIAEIETDAGVFAGRDHRVTIAAIGAAA